MSIKDTKENSRNHLELGQRCGDVVKKLYRRLEGKKPGELTKAAIEAIGDLTK
jgi:hypothetical protein